MARIYKEITINAPPQKIFSYLTKPSNLPQIWPNVVEIKNEQLLPSGGYIAEWVYKMCVFRSKKARLSEQTGRPFGVNRPPFRTKSATY